MKRSISLILALVLVLSLFPAVWADSAPAVSSNLDDHFYINAGRFYHPIYSNLAWENGQYVRAEAIGSDLVVETYDRDFNYLSGQTIPLELPVFGGVRMDSDYNFVVVGQDNLNEDDSVEVFRIIRYTKDWQKIDHASLFGANTYIPFDAGSLRFDRSGDILYIRTAHEMYDSGDGLHHQANVMISVRISDMTVTDELTEVLNRNYGYISHSFNQFVRVDGDTLLAVDHGDALPRSVVLIKYGRKAGEEQFFGRVSYVNALPIANSTYHYNDTGVSVGGFECSSTDYLIAGSAYDMSETVDLMYAHRNIFVTATPKDDFTDEGTVLHWLTDYSESDDVEVSPPHLLKLSADRFFLTWTEDGQLKYCFLNGHGGIDGEIYTMEGDLSDCVPILADGKIVWYVTDRSAPVFYEIPTHAHDYQAAVTAPTCTEGGFTTYTCAECGDSYVSDHTAPLGHGWSSWYTVKEPSCTEIGYQQRDCSRCGIHQTQRLPALGHDWQGTECGRCGEKRMTPFDDVEPGSFYELPVAWAVEEGITNGTTPTTFDPNGKCQRAQVVTFLWRAAGEPEPAGTENPFLDVKESDFFYKAVLWAVEEGITNGLDAAHFGPYAHCNRAQVVTFLWRSVGCPSAKADNPFTDVKAGLFYETAVLWAVENSITNGLSATEFGVSTVCNRAQIVTFLYRTFA